MFTSIVLLALATAPSRPVPRIAADAVYRPKVEVWTDNGNDPYRSGDGVNVHIRADQDAYVTVIRVDTDGRVRVLFPREPWEDNFVRGTREYEVQGAVSSEAFTIDDSPGVGYVFAVASADPFVYDPIEAGDHWDYRTIADGRVHGDPYVALTDIAQRIVQTGNTDWDYDLVPYYVQQHYDYPRFLCYDCHAYASFSYWDPYAYSCTRFRMVVYDDPYYYPYRYYGGTNVVFVRPFRPEPRFIFRDRTGNGNGDDRFITVVPQRPVNDNGRRGVSGRDVGGVGVIPFPRERQSGGQNNPSQPDNHRDDGGRRGRDDPRGGQGQPDTRGADGRGNDGRRQPPSPPAWQPQPQPQPRDQSQPQGDRRPVPVLRPPVVEQPRDDGRRQPPAMQPERPRPEPRPEPRAEPPRRDPPRAEPRPQPRNDPPPKQGNDQPELRRRKP